MYRRLLDLQYTSEKPLPMDERQLFRLTRAATDLHREAVLTVLHEFFTETDEGWVSARAMVEIDAMREKQQKQRDRANKRWHKPDADTGNATAMPRHETEDATAQKSDANAMPPTPTPTPTPKSKRESRASAPARPDDVSEQTWADWLELRKAKRSPVTMTVLEGARDEAAKAGMPLEQFLGVWCTRGSQGLRADWLKPEERSRSPTGETAYQRSARERVAAFAPGVAVRTNVIDEVPNVVAIARS